MISAPAKEKIQSHIDDALAKGAVNVTPENATFALAKTAGKGNWLAPVVLTNVNHSMVTMKEETFGPVMPIMKVSSDEEAVSLMNDSDYGLTASVWTKDIAAGEKLIDDIEAGTVFINRCDYPAPVCFSPTSNFMSPITNSAERISPGQDGRLLALDVLLDLGHTMVLQSSRATTLRVSPLKTIYAYLYASRWIRQLYMI